jgi:hypothetical protein
MKISALQIREPAEVFRERMTKSIKLFSLPKSGSNRLSGVRNFNFPIPLGAQLRSRISQIGD